MDIAIIPARGGSKSILKKNLSKVGPSTLIQRAIVCAKDAGIKDIFVSTDDSEIAKEAERFGAYPVMRPAELSGDKSSSESAILNTLQHISPQYDFNEVKISFLQATSPFTNSEDLGLALELVNSQNSIFSAIPFHSFLWRGVGAEWVPSGHQKNLRQMKEDLTPQVIETGNFYCFPAALFMVEKTRFCGKPMPFLVNPSTIHQIDSIEDLAFATELVKILDQS